MAERESRGSDPITVTGNQSKTNKKAKGVKQSDLKTENPEEIDRVSTVDVPECAVCLQNCVQPVQLPCGHIFCFLCVKGVANQSKRCALCRNEIPMEFLNCPNLVKPIERIPPAPGDVKEGYTWFYEGRNGWWQYDERTTVELEEAYKQKNRCIELLIAGFLYVIDFENMIQIRRNDPTRRRRIKRDLTSVPMKGIAGIKYLPSSVLQDQRQGDGDEIKNTDTAAVTKVTAAPAGDQDVNSTSVRLGAITISDQNDDEDDDGEAANQDERVVSSTASSDRAQASTHSERTTHRSHRKSPNSLTSMSTQVLAEGVQSTLPHGLRLRRGGRRQNRHVDSTSSREDYLSNQPEYQSDRRYVQRNHEDTAAQFRYDGDVDSSDNDE